MNLEIGDYVVVNTENLDNRFAYVGQIVDIKNIGKSVHKEYSLKILNPNILKHAREALAKQDDIIRGWMASDLIKISEQEAGARCI